ncbi:MAG: hypothetical protein F6K42_27545 [Leptolyngbya sp. SIO1D8]|nr:hypothetical protein [Leptolyngbya sp. SIO1D8]
MNADLEALRITKPQLEQLTGLDISSVFMGGVVRPSTFRSARRLLSLLVTECSVLGVIFIICLGLGLVIVRSWSDFANVAVLLISVAGITVAIAIAWNFYQWIRYQTLISLARLLDEVDRHNDIVQAVQVMDELETVQAASLKLPNRADVMMALQATRESLVSALMTERVLRRHRRFIQRRQALFSNIETNLMTLQTLQVNNQATEYQQFLQEALEIGLAVRQEMERHGS